MSGYRFCRTDDIPLLVDAYNACCGDRAAVEPALTVEDFKRAAREIGLWASSCMVAFEGELPIAVLLGAKSESANLVYRLAVRPGHEGEGHGRHLVESLRNKVAILGPPRLVAEVPAAWTGVGRFFERCGFKPERRYADFVVDTLAEPFAATDLVSAVTVDELLQSGAIDSALPRPWQRSRAALQTRRGDLEGLAIASDERVEAFALFRAGAPACELAALGAARRELLFPLLGELCRRSRSPLRIDKVTEEELPEAVLLGLGFRRETEYIGYAANVESA